MRGIGIEHGLEVYYCGRSLMSVEDAWSLLEALFDEEYYARRHPDLTPDEQSLAHYIATGWRERRDPSDVFSTTDYLAENQYLLELDFCPLLHYALSGAADGKLPSRGPRDGRPATVIALFDAAYYAKTYPEVNTAGDPLGHYLRDGWRFGLNPSAAFDTAYYLETNPEVRAADICPLVHYALYGLSSGRAPTRPRGAAEIAISKCRSREERTRGALRPLRPDRVERDRLHAIFASATAARGNGVLLSLSHDDYAENAGGLQNCIGDEAHAFLAAGFVHVHACPARPLLVLADETEADFLVSVRVDGEAVGVAALDDVARALAETRRASAPLYVVVHHLMGFAPEAVIAAARTLSPDRSIVMVHDLFTLCAEYAMLRNNVAFCHGPSVASKACRICNYGAERPDHLRRVGALFQELQPTVLTGSETAAQFWRARAEYPHQGVVVMPLGRLSLEPSQGAAPVGYPLRIGFLGGASYHKGWDVFEGLAARFQGDSRYRFFHFGFAPGTPNRNVQFVKVAVGSGDREAMIREVRINELDIAINWSRCYETFSWTAHEAVAGGALVIARRGAGNVWPSLSHPDIGRAVGLDTEAELHELFVSGGVLGLDLRRRYGALAINATTAMHLLGHPDGR